jgi:nuclear pore complex protein Nup107
MVQSRQAEEKIRAMLTFAGGWLMEEEQGDDTMDTREVGEQQVERTEQMVELRSSLLPRTVTLLHSLLHSTGQYGKCVALADLFVGEQHGIYQSFTRQGVQELLTKIRESSLAGMEQGKDPWGFNKQ